MLTVMSANDMRPSVQPLVGVFMICFMTLCVPKSLFAIIDGIGHLFKATIVRRIFRISGMCMALFSALILCYGYFCGRSRFVVNEKVVCFANLPEAFDGYRIAHFSDMHIGTFSQGHEGDVEKIVRIINSCKCDAILFTGDLVNHQSAELNGFKDVLSRLSAPDGVYSVMGNHDYSMYIRYGSEAERQADADELRRRQRSYGWRLLQNENSLVRRGDDSIAIVGVENSGRPPFPMLGDLAKAQEGLADGCFKILLSHDPTHWRREVADSTDISLTLSGHTHSGQFKVFGWSPVKHVYDEWSGVYISEGGQALNVTDGIGVVMFPFRFGAWPEVDVITLRRKV